MQLHIRTLLPVCALACSIMASAPSRAATHSVYNYLNPGAACQLSIPTTDTEVRPKATGFRNESTTKSAFVICGFTKPTNDSFSTLLEIYFTSIDGAIRTINCTAVTGLPGVYAPIYSSKSVTSGETWAMISWYTSDFGGTSDIPYSFSPSITCTLPPQTAITLLDNRYNLDVGN